jgi:hypothetical protein
MINVKCLMKDFIKHKFSVFSAKLNKKGKATLKSNQNNQINQSNQSFIPIFAVQFKNNRELCKSRNY